MNDIKEVLHILRRMMPDRRLEKHEAFGIAERQASKLLELLEITELPVDVAQIAELSGVTVNVKSQLTIKGKLSSGGSWFDKTGWNIVLNADDSRTRRRFTMGHEFKHVIDDPYIDVLYRGADSDEAAERRAEDICDYFAGCLLMPRPMVKKLWASGIQDQRTLAAHFGVSPLAMSVRLTLLGLLEPRWQHHPRTYDAWEPSIRSCLRPAPATALPTPIAA